MSIELYTWDSPNGRKISVVLGKMGLAYRVPPVSIFKGEQFDPALSKISPAGW
jgi:GSH-dependent disulfide-bond oxidoreductase